MLMSVMSNFYPSESFSQKTGSVTGRITNQAEIPIPEASICLLNAMDSILVKFTYSQLDGKFNFEDLPSGDFLLLVSYANYADFVDHFTINAQNPTHAFGTIQMSRKEIVLEEVIIKARRDALKMNGDTIEYDVGSVVIQPNDKVEDLLKRLPGIQVDRDGKITAQGQIVTKILVDGEEFFADDPKLVTRNLRADMVDKIQVFDKASDRAAFTGIADGVKTRSINVKLKEDKKNGLFGKVSAGAGSDGYYQGQGMFNRFNKNQKFSAYGTIANNGSTGLSDDDFGSIGSSGITLPKQGLVIPSVGDNPMETYEGTYDGYGFPRSKNGGAHYNNKWNEGRESINTNYQLGSTSISGNSTNLVQQNLTEGILNNVVQNNFDNHSHKQRLNAIYRHATDGSSELGIDLIGGIEKFSVISNYHSTTTTELGSLVNDQERSLTNNGDRQAINLNSYYAKKFKKEKRTLTISINGNFNHGNNYGYLRSKTSISNTDSIEITDQLKTSDIENISLGSEIEYTEPLSKSFTLQMKYGVALDNSESDRKSFNHLDGSGYTALDRDFSNHYNFSQFGNKGGIRLNYNYRKKIYMNVGTDVTGVTFRQDDLNSLTSYKRYFLNWSPYLYLHFVMKGSQFIMAKYRGANSQPTIEQIQPVRNNTDPLNIRLGNPGLKPSFNNKIEIDYNKNVVNGNYVYLDFDYAFTQSAITHDVSTEISTGKTILRYVNLSQQVPYNFKFGATLGMPIGDTDIKLYLGMDTRRNVMYNYINGALNTATFASYMGSISVYWQRDNKFNFSLAFKPDYTFNRLSLQKQNNNNAKGFLTSGSLKVFLPAKIQIDSRIDYSYRGKTAIFQDFQRVMWNASISRKMLKSNNLKLLLSGYDMLNQNQRFDRSVAGNTFSQYTAAVIQRYFMLSLSWDFTKFGSLTASTD